MPGTSPFRIRFALVAIFSLMVLGFLLPPSNAQPGRPPGGIGGRPPGGIGGMPGGSIAGRPPGGISGMPGGIHGISGISGMPGGISGISGIGGIGGMPGGGIGGGTQRWTCSRCGFLLGVGPVDPGQPICPGCGARFTGSSPTPGGVGGIGGMPSTPPIVPPSTPGMPFNPGGIAGTPPMTPGGIAGVPGSAPPLPMNPALGGPSGPDTSPTPFTTPGAGDTQPQNTSPPSGSSSSASPSNSNSSSSSDSSSSSSDSSSSSSSGGRSKTIKLIGIVCGSILLLGALAALGVVVANANASKPTKRPKRRRMVEDD